MPTTLPNTGLKKPTVGGDSDAWGTTLNENADTLEAMFDAGPTLKVARLPIATTAQIRANTADRIPLTDEAWAAVDAVALTDATTIAVDMSTFINASLTLGGNRTLGNPTNTKPLQCGTIIITQDGTGSRTLAYGSSWKFAGGSAPVLTTTANARDILFYTVISSTVVYAALAKDVR